MNVALEKRVHVWAAGGKGASGGATGSGGGGGVVGEGGGEGGALVTARKIARILSIASNRYVPMSFNLR